MNKKNYGLLWGYLSISLIIIFFLILFPGKKNTPTSTFDDVVNLLENGDYPEDPYSMINTNNKFLMCLYGGGILDEEIEPVLLKQRLLFSSELLELNPFETHLARTMEQIAEYREKGFYVHTTNIEDVTFDKEDNKICYVKIRQHNNNLTNQETMFYLVLRDDTWKIIGWEAIQEEATE